ncbi:nuclear transport factor 2 family protein [Sphingomonas sp. SUN019]|uniref:nuclear transport factor 2 family protein n=1 Tax=Sphingomonas sp. SUN019 TaxID=2937788 RepID=UPI002164D269|nr:nuclear transport factor 2 family protein [Sphingomonas sp. SUN019]UVO51271.1 nuclear transport factor 2 family protein [Sphingomonas sp. SUN019]
MIEEGVVADVISAEERRAIEWDCARLINLYAMLNDEARWTDVAALYAEDGSMTRPTAPDAPIVGRAAILAAFTARPPRITRHMTANIVVDVVDADNATATSAMLLFTAPDKPPLVGGFVDRLRRVSDEGWRFVERRGTLSFA